MNHRLSSTHIYLMLLILLAEVCDAVQIAGGGCSDQELRSGCAACNVGSNGDCDVAASRLTVATCGGGYGSKICGRPHPNGGGLFAVCPVCRTCVAGEYSQHNVRQPCIPCARGKYSGNTASGCTSCAMGKHAPGLGSTGCVSCPTLTFAFPGSSVCTDCSVGRIPGVSIQTNPERVNCDDCPSGKAAIPHQGTWNSAQHCKEPCAVGSGRKIGNDICQLCETGTYSLDMGNCHECPADHYNNLEGQSKCELCENGKTSTSGSTLCIECEAGKYANNDLDGRLVGGGCVLCAANTVSRSTGSSVCELCPNGQTSAVGSIDCENCFPCYPGSYRVNCRSRDVDGKLTQGACQECQKCDPNTQVLVDCDWRGGRNNASGSCQPKELMSRTATCVDTVAGNSDLMGRIDRISHIEPTDGSRNIIPGGMSGLNGFSFDDVFGASQEGADGVNFVCSALCDGTQTYDSTQCNGPYACGVQACAMVVDTQSVLTAHACPLVITPTDHMDVMYSKQQASCQDCRECGTAPDGLTVPDDWGRGCAQECSRLLCRMGDIYDWTDESQQAFHRCKPCRDLQDVRLCTTADRSLHGLDSMDISGNRPLLQFDDCAPKQGANIVSYGSCRPCESVSTCGDMQYFARCPSDINNGCDDCARRDGMSEVSSAWYVDVVGDIRKAHCQVRACVDEARTGVRDDGAVCVASCTSLTCDPTETRLPCMLPHDTQCLPAYPSQSVGSRVRQDVMPAHTSMLESADTESHQFASFENILVDLAELPAHRHQCVWNAIHVTDNNMNPGGVSTAWFRDSEVGEGHVLQETGSKFCTPIFAPDSVLLPPRSGVWKKNLSTVYPLLPLQNTVAFSSNFPRRVLMNTSASAMQYLRPGRGFDGNGNAYYDSIKAISPPRSIPNPGELFLNVDLKQSREAVVSVFVPTDRVFPTWVPMWRFGFVTRETTMYIEEHPAPIWTIVDVHEHTATKSLYSVYVPELMRQRSVSTHYSVKEGTIFDIMTEFQVSLSSADSTGSIPSSKCFWNMEDVTWVSKVKQRFTLLDRYVAIFQIGTVGRIRKHTSDNVLVGADLAMEAVIVDMHGSTSQCLAYISTEKTIFCVGYIQKTDALLNRMVVYEDSKFEDHIISFTVSENAERTCDTLHVVWYDDSAEPPENGNGIFTVLFGQCQTGTDSSSDEGWLADKHKDDLMRVATKSDGTLLLKVSTRVVEVVWYQFSVPEITGITQLVDAETGGVILEPARARVSSALITHEESGRIFVACPVRHGIEHRMNFYLLNRDLNLLNSGSSALHVFTTSTVGYISTVWGSEDCVFIGFNGVVLSVTLTEDALDVVEIVDSFLRDSHFTSSEKAYIQLLFVSDVFDNSHFIDPVPFDASLDAIRSCTIRTCVLLTDFVSVNPSGLLPFEPMVGYFAMGGGGHTIKTSKIVNFFSASGSEFSDAISCTRGLALVSSVCEARLLDNTLASPFCLEVTLSMDSIAAIVFPDNPEASVTVVLLSDHTAQKEYTSGPIVAHQLQTKIVIYTETQSEADWERDDPAEVYLKLCGGVQMTSIYKSPQPPDDAQRFILLRNSKLLPLTAPVSGSAWTYMHTYMRQMHPGRDISITLRRTEDADTALQTQRTVAIDALTLLPVLSMQPYFIATSTTEARALLKTRMYVPTLQQLQELNLSTAVHGNNTEGWERLHVTVAMQWASPQTCAYTIGIGPVLDTNKHNSALHRLGCGIQARQDTYAVCHLEVPTALVIAGQIPSVLIYAHPTSACAPPLQLTAVLEPYTTLFTCPHHDTFWDYHLQSCEPCARTDVDADCGPGEYVPGCDALVHMDGNGSACKPCPQDLDAATEAWLVDAECAKECLPGVSFRNDPSATCVRCNTRLGPDDCDPGLQPHNCTTERDQHCDACPARGFYGAYEHFVARAGESCATACNNDTYLLAGDCRPCATREALLARYEFILLGLYLRFSPCSAGSDAAAHECPLRTADGLGSVIGHAPAFNVSCQYRCDIGAHHVGGNTSAVCVACGNLSDWDGSVVPHARYRVTSTECDIECLPPWYAYNRSCWRCDESRCGNGQYLHNCSECRDCTSPGEHWLFTGAGVWLADACPAECEDGYWDDFGRCSAHTPWATAAAACEPEHYVRNGSQASDTTCMPCRSCERQLLTVNCSLARNSMCRACSTLTLDEFHGTRCQQRCQPGRVAFGGGGCETCLARCPPGQVFPEDRRNCTDCRQCPNALPAGHVWFAACESSKNTLQQQSQGLLAETVPPLVVCQPDEFELGVGRGLLCLPCASRPDSTRPPFIEFGMTWAWAAWSGAGPNPCLWQCMPGLERFEESAGGAERCATYAAVEATVASGGGTDLGSMAESFKKKVREHKQSLIERLGTQNLFIAGAVVALTFSLVIFLY